MVDAIGAHPARAKVPRMVDPDAGLGGFLRSVLDRIKFDIHL